MTVEPADLPAQDSDGDRRMMPLYAAVVVIEALVILGLWAMGRYFGV